ncbi:unnamed protein product [Zymoseptoria tritici ST99CH_1E4]|uniref:Uncharacterized protein n=1 Tax=Zymoseptoria tritici ST99CH_1E4 TaxID=1276532 RepID=A0A2H1H907_ZYMTR|nr:unnamed protein product [Zymoseptoria tritici ST99CH_1E4]
MADANHEGEGLVYEHGGGICVQSEDETEAEPIAQERDSLHKTIASYRNNTPKSEKVVASSQVAKEARRAAGEETGAALQASLEGIRGHTPRVSWMDSSASSPKKNKNGVLPPQLSSKVPANQQPTRKQGYITTTTTTTIIPTTFTTEALHRAFITAETLWRERDFARCVVEISRAMALVVPFVRDESRLPRNGVEEDEHQHEHEHEHRVDEGEWEGDGEEGQWEDDVYA